MQHEEVVDIGIEFFEKCCHAFIVLHLSQILLRPFRYIGGTPWMRRMAEDNRRTILFPNAYSCAMHTVQSLEKALTEYNQYNGRQFYDSCSIIDIAHRLGYRVHWYSNQGHLGANDTPITLVANTADVAKWKNSIPMSTTSSCCI